MSTSCVDWDSEYPNQSSWKCSAGLRMATLIKVHGDMRLTNYYHGCHFALHIPIRLRRWRTCIIFRSRRGLEEEEAMMQSIYHYSPFPVPQERFRTPLYIWPVICYRGLTSSSEIFKWHPSRMCGCKVLKPTPLYDQRWCHHQLETCCLWASL